MDLEFKLVQVHIVPLVQLDVKLVVQPLSVQIVSQTTDLLVGDV